MEKQEFIENVKDQNVLKKALQNGHSDQRHEDKPLSSLLKRVLTYKADAASSFFPNVDKNALIRDALINNADKILERLKDTINGDKFTISFSTPEIIGNGFYRDDTGFVEPRKTNTMFLLLESNNKNEPLGFNIKTAYPNLRRNFEHDSTIDPLKVLKETELYQRAGTTRKLFYEMILGENSIRNHDDHDTLIEYAFKSEKKDENSKNNEEKRENIYIKYCKSNENDYLHGRVSEDGIEVAKKDENGNHIDWIMGKADKKYILLDNNKAIQKFKGYCPRLYELLDDIKGKLDARLEKENIRKEDTRTEKEHQAPENSIPSRPSGGGGPDDR